MFTLRPINPAQDAPALHNVFGDEEQSRYLLKPACKTVAETQALLEKYGRESSPTRWVIETDAGEVAGTIALFSDDGGWSAETGYEIGREWEIGFMMCPAFQGRGMMYKAACQALEIFDPLVKPRRIFADIDPDNTASIRLCERLGFRYEGTLRNRWHTHIGVHDAVMMSLIEGDLRPWRSTTSPLPSRRART